MFMYIISDKQKVVLKVLTMTDDKTKQKAIEAAADIYGTVLQAHLLNLTLFPIELKSGKWDSYISELR